MACPPFCMGYDKTGNSFVLGLQCSIAAGFMAETILATATFSTSQKLFSDCAGQNSAYGFQRGHAPHDTQLILKRYLLGAYIFACQQAHAAEYAGIVADQFIKVFGSAVVARVNIKTRQSVDTCGPYEVIAHKGRAAGRHAAAAFHAAVKLKDFVGKRVGHALFLGIGLKRFAGVHPRFNLLPNLSEPRARIHREISQQFEHWQGVQDDMVGQVGSTGVAGKARPAIDDHGA